MPATHRAPPPASGTTTSANTSGATVATPGTRRASGNTVSSSAAPRPVISKPARPAIASMVRPKAPSVLILVTRTAMNTATPRAIPTRGNNARKRCCTRSGTLTKRHNVNTLPFPLPLSPSPPRLSACPRCNTGNGPIAQLDDAIGTLHDRVIVRGQDERFTDLLTTAIEQV